MNKSTTDTPRTDVWAYWIEDGDIEVVYASISRSLEQELAHSLENQVKAQAEIEFWKAKAYEAEHSEGKHEVEVERLTESIQSITKIAIDTESEKWKLMEEVERLKELVTN